MIKILSNTFSLLNCSHKRKIYSLFFLIFFGLILEMIGLGLILPVVTLLTNKEYLFDKEVDVLDIMDNGVVDNTQLYIVPENHFFVLGDNRDNSQDSRFIGFIPKKNLVGRAELVFVNITIYFC